MIIEIEIPDEHYEQFTEAMLCILPERNKKTSVDDHIRNGIVGIVNHSARKGIRRIQAQQEPQEPLNIARAPRADS